MVGGVFFGGEKMGEVYKVLEILMLVKSRNVFSWGHIKKIHTFRIPYSACFSVLVIVF